jgi:membrane fusion protein (multidrug efflux system)
MFVTENGEIWVTADFKETQLARMHRGERVSVHVDTFGRNYRGYVGNLPGASGERFSLLQRRTPPETT